MRYALVGGKRVRAVICLATVEAAGADAEAGLPAAASLELVHAFSLVHDDLPALDNDAERRGRPSVWAQHGEAVAVLAGDALLAEAFRLALRIRAPAGRPRARAGDARHDRRPVPRHHRLRAGRGDAAQAQDGLSVRRVRRHGALGGAVPSASRLPGVRSATSSGSCSRSSTTSSTATATSSHMARTAPATLADEAAIRARERLAGSGRHVDARRHRRRPGNANVVT